MTVSPAARRFAQITQQIMDFDSQQANEDGAYPVGLYPIVTS
jgi:hypothetical protein